MAGSHHVCHQRCFLPDAVHVVAVQAHVRVGVGRLTDEQGGVWAEGPPCVNKGLVRGAVPCESDGLAIYY